MTSCDIENGILFKNVRLIDPATNLDIIGSLLTEGDQIKAINPSSYPKGSKIIDGHGAVLCPGFIDLRASLGEPGAEYRETLLTGSQAAVAGGITSIGVMPDTTPTIDTSFSRYLY